MTARCGYAVTDPATGEQAPCDEPATGWRWYQDCEHEPALERACGLHANDGGEAVAQIVAERDGAVARAKKAEAERNDAERRISTALAAIRESDHQCATLDAVAAILNGAKQ